MAPIFLTSELVGGEWSASRPGRYIPGEKAKVSDVGWVPQPVWKL
jgi:hypothetical protein